MTRIEFMAPIVSPVCVSRQVCCLPCAGAPAASWMLFSPCPVRSPGPAAVGRRFLHTLLLLLPPHAQDPSRPHPRLMNGDLTCGSTVPSLSASPNCHRSWSHPPVSILTHATFLTPHCLQPSHLAAGFSTPISSFLTPPQNGILCPHNGQISPHVFGSRRFAQGRS